MNRLAFDQKGTALSVRCSKFLANALALAVCFALANNATAQTGTPEPGPGEKPVATTDADGPIISPVGPVHDFGDVWTGEDLKHTFVIKNTGTKPLVIKKVKPACGCTKKGKHPNEIAPGESGEFTFGLATKKLHGKFTKAITVTTNDPKHESTILKLTGEVKHFVEVTPNAATFGKLKEDSVMTKKLQVRNNTGEKLEIKLDDSANSGCFVSDLAEVVPGMEYELTVTAQPPFKSGNNRHTIKLLTNHPKQKELTVTALALVPQRLELRPDRITVAAEAKTQSKRRLRFSNNGDSLVHVTDVTTSADSDKLTTELKTLTEGKNYEVTITIPANYTPPSAGVSIVMTTDDKEMPKLEVPIVANTPREKPRRPAELMLGKVAPENKMKTVAGDEVNIGGKSEEVEVLFFYASWCGFCKKALPKAEELHKSLQASNKKAKIYAINLDDRSGRRGRTEEQTLQHYKDMDLSIPLILDSDKTIGRPFQVTSFPTMFVVGQSGVVEAVHVGAKNGFEDSLAREIDILLAGKKLVEETASTDAAAAIKGKVVSKEMPVKQATLAGTKSKGEPKTAPSGGVAKKEGVEE